MASAQSPNPTELAAQLEHPNANSIWERALEVFGDEAMAHSWMNTPRDIFGGRGDPSAQRSVLEVLLRIDYGVFS